MGLLGHRPVGRVLELGCGNGSNTRELARRSLSLDACDGALAALGHARSTVGDGAGVAFHHLPLPGRFPRAGYDAVVISELLYYLGPLAMAAVMAEIDRTLRPKGRLVLCHHHRQFGDAAQKQSGLHARFLACSRAGWKAVRRHRTARWDAQAWIRRA